jgi:hypothetical protein
MSQYVQFWIVLITVPNLIVIGVMIALFVAAVFVTLPHPSEK